MPPTPDCFCGLPSKRTGYQFNCSRNRCPFRTQIAASAPSNPQIQPATTAPKQLHTRRCDGHNEPLEIVHLSRSADGLPPRSYLRCARPPALRCNSVHIPDAPAPPPTAPRLSQQSRYADDKRHRCNHGDLAKIITQPATSVREGKRYAQCARNGNARCSYFKLVDTAPPVNRNISARNNDMPARSPLPSSSGQSVPNVTSSTPRTNDVNLVNNYGARNDVNAGSSTMHRPRSRSGEANAIGGGDPIVVHCDCGVEAVARTVTQKTPNQGRKYYLCGDSNRCTLFKWADEAPNPNSYPPKPSQERNQSSAGATTDIGLQSSAVLGRNPGNQNTSGILFEDEEEETQNCRCGQEAVRRTVKKVGPNTGRDFFACKKPQKLQCGFFAWATRPSSSSSGMRPSTAGTTNSSHSGHQMQQNGGAEQIRPQSNVSVILLAMDEIDSLTFKLHFTTVQETRDAVKRYRHAKITKTEVQQVEKVSIPLDKLDDFENYLNALAGTRVVCEVPEATRNRIRTYVADEKRRVDNGDLVTRPLDEILPSLVCEKLMEFQWHGVHFALKRGGRCLIGDDMGLGKTLQAIAVARVYMEDWPLLIVCPSSLRLNWKEEILQWLGEDVTEDNIHVIMTGKDADIRLNLVNIVSYDLFRKIPQHSLGRCGFVIADESHYLKNGQAKRSKAVLPVIKNAKRALLLSGTPALSRPVELFAQVNAILPNLFPNYMDFVQRYCDAHKGTFGWDVRGASNLSELNAMLKGSLLIRRKKEEVLTQLPDKQRQVIWVETTAKLMTDVQAAQKDLETAKVAQSEAAPGANMMRLQNEIKSAQNRLYTTTGLAKLESILQFCKDTAAGDCKFIVFAHHVDVIQGLSDFFINKLKLGIIKIDGSTQQKHRQGLCKKFQTDPECRVAVLSITAAGVGLTLTKATVVLFAELYWNPGSLLQAEDRAHRIGQKDCVFVKYLLARNTIDQSMWSTVRKKLSVVGHSLTGTAARMDVVDEPNDVPPPADGGIERFFQKSKDEISNVKETAAHSDVDEIVLFDEDSQPAMTGNESNPAPRLENDDSVIEVPFPTMVSQDNSQTVTPPSSKRRHRSQPNTPSSRKRSKGCFPAVDLVTEGTEEKQIDNDLVLARRLQEKFDREMY